MYLEICASASSECSSRLSSTGQLLRQLQHSLNSHRFWEYYSLSQPRILKISSGYVGKSCLLKALENTEVYLSGGFANYCASHCECKFKLALSQEGRCMIQPLDVRRRGSNRCQLMNQMHTRLREPSMHVLLEFCKITLHYENGEGRQFSSIQVQFHW